MNDKEHAGNEIEQVKSQPHIIYKKLEESETEGTKEIILEYVKWLNRDLCFQNIDDELNSFPKKYQEPDGAVIIAKDDDNVVGCVGLRKIDDGVCEMKRLFVKENYQGQGIGKTLIEKIIEEARMKNYKIMRLDTLDTMERALKIYFGKGFYKVDPYYSNPHNGVIYLEKELLHNYLINENSDE